MALVVGLSWLRELLTAPNVEHWRRRYLRGLSVAVGAPVLGLALALAEQAGADGPEAAYTTTHPGKNPPWLGLATRDARYKVLLGDGCDAIAADMNVLLERSDDTNEATWILQPPQSDQSCTVVEWHWAGNMPCFTNDAGECDVAYS